MSLEVISRFVVDGLIEAVVDGAFAILILVILFLYDWRLGLLVTGFLILYGIVRLALLPLSRKLQTDEQINKAKEADTFLETLTAMQTIKLSGVEIEREGIWRNRATESANSGILAGNIQIIYTTLGQGIIAMSQISVVLVAGLAIINGNLSIGMLTAFLAYKSQLETRAISLLNKWADLKLLQVHLDRVSDIAFTSRERMIVSSAKTNEFKGAVQLQNVEFQYGPFEPVVLRGIDLDIEPGEFVALAGPSGQGKSTLLRLLLGLYQPTSGRILFDGLEVEAWGLSNLRKQIGVVMQDDVLLAGSIAENISNFSRGSDLERVIDAAKTAAIHDEILRMPMGYETLVGDMGSTLSGGQKQRIMIARAIYKQPRLLILDEGTSNLDIATEAKINDALKSLKITRIAAAHRPDTLAKADRVLHIVNGCLFTAASFTSDNVRVVRTSDGSLSGPNGAPPV